MLSPRVRATSSPAGSRALGPVTSERAGRRDALTATCTGPRAAPASLLRPVGLAAALLGCAAPRAPVSSPTRAASSHATTVPFRLIDNRLFVDARINGRGPYAFIFDTGGANLVTPAVARELGLDTAAAGDATGAGEGRTPMQTTRIREFRVGDRALVDGSFMVIDLGQIQRAFGFARLDGVFGYEMLARFVVTIDYDAGRLTFDDSVTPGAARGAVRVPFSLVGDKPVVRGTINGLEARVLLDTGDRSALTVLSRFLVHPEVGRVFEGAPSQATGYGIGGPIPARLGTVSVVALADGIELHDVAARAPTTHGGFNAVEGIDASVGNEVLRQFVVTFDYGARVLYLARGRSFGGATRFTPVPNAER